VRERREDEEEFGLKVFDARQFGGWSWCSGRRVVGAVVGV